MSVTEDEKVETPAAEQVEPEGEPEPEPDGDEDDQIVPEPEPEPENAAASGAQTERDVEKAAKALGKEAEKHAAAVSRIMGEDALGLVLCEACEPGIPGFHWPASLLPTDDPRRPLYEMLSMGEDGSLAHPERYSQCAYCKGYGKVLTGSRETLTATITCPECKGAGYFDRNANRPTPPPDAPASTGNGATATPEAPAPTEDFVGRPVGHPNYGKLSQYLTPAELALDVNDGYAV